MILSHEIKRIKPFDINDIRYIVNYQPKETTGIFIPKKGGEIIHNITGETGVVKYDTEYIFNIIPIIIQGKVRRQQNNDDYMNYFYYNSLSEEMVDIQDTEVFVDIEEAKSEINKWVKEINEMHKENLKYKIVITK